jgi:hypothetical protein
MPDPGGQPHLSEQQIPFKNKLMSLDATVIDLCASVFDWAQFRRTKGAVNLMWVRWRWRSQGVQCRLLGWSLRSILERENPKSGRREES